jgi:hypothetical protein
MTDLYGGSFENYAGSMAQAIETALNDLRQERGLDPLPAGDLDRQILFIAIARGVINHLKANEQAFNVAFNVDPTATTTLYYNVKPTISVKNP